MDVHELGPVSALGKGDVAFAPKVQSPRGGVAIGDRSAGNVSTAKPQKGEKEKGVEGFHRGRKTDFTDTLSVAPLSLLKQRKNEQTHISESTPAAFFQKTHANHSQNAIAARPWPTSRDHGLRREKHRSPNRCVLARFGALRISKKGADS